MDTLQFDEPVLTKRLARLSPSYRTAFAACSAERVCPAYKRFANDQQHSAENALSRYLEAVWTSLDKNLSTDWNDELNKCLGLTPSDEAQTMESAAYAEDAVAATCYAIRSIISGDPRESVWAARRAYEAVDQYALRRRRSAGKHAFDEAEILRHPACQRELHRQLQDLAYLEKNGGTVLTKLEIGYLRQRAVTDSSTMFTDT